MKSKRQRPHENLEFKIVAYYTWRKFTGFAKTFTQIIAVKILSIMKTKYIKIVKCSIKSFFSCVLKNDRNGLHNKMIDSYETCHAPSWNRRCDWTMCARCTLHCLCSRRCLIQHRKRALIIPKHVRGHLKREFRRQALIT